MTFVIHAAGKMVRAAVCCALCLALVPWAVFTQSLPRGDVDEEMVKSPALQGNLLGDSATRHVSIYLPPSYGKGPSHYPVVYLLHGYLGSDQSWIAGDWANVPKIADRLIAAGKMREMIIVMPDGSNKFLGSMYTDSPTTGNWEEFITQDLVHYVDRHFRTAARAESRGIAGHSMGGYGALKLAMKHPDVFSAVYAMSACCMEWGPDLSPANAAWDRVLGFERMDQFAATQAEFWHPKAESDRAGMFFSMAFMAMAAAWSPDPERPPFFVDLPVEKRDGGRAMLQAVMAEWSANMIVPASGQYRANLARLHGLSFDVGKQEQFPSILAGARDFSQALKRNGIQHEFEEYEGTHMSKIGERIETKVLPFFSRVLE
ncbi:MAG TPA: alpha/beta fold hydrolase [Candidatus Acidoferrales bacterium]|nr:alpha/beta fold hydrolase [Candidatus Acidoferrales bacterium]